MCSRSMFKKTLCLFKHFFLDKPSVPNWPFSTLWKTDFFFFFFSIDSSWLQTSLLYQQTFLNPTTHGLTPYHLWTTIALLLDKLVISIVYLTCTYTFPLAPPILHYVNSSFFFFSFKYRTIAIPWAEICWNWVQKAPDFWVWLLDVPSPLCNANKLKHHWSSLNWCLLKSNECCPKLELHTHNTVIVYTDTRLWAAAHSPAGKSIHTIMIHAWNIA